jgi:hypothetical protein
MSDSDSGTLHSATGGGVSGSLAPADDLQLLVGPTTSDQFNKARLRLIPVACWRVDDIRFAFDSSFVALELNKEIQHLSDLREQHKKVDAKSGSVLFPPISLFGHADPVGDDTYNKFLSGRRAAAIYGMLVRRTDIWEDLYSDTGIFAKPVLGDKWGQRALDAMQTATGLPAGTSRKTLFKAYMDLVCTPPGGDGTPFLLNAKDDFLAQGADASGKGDFQGCGEFNPRLIFSQTEETAFEQSKDKTARNLANAENRRVMALLFRPGSRIVPAQWPCPLAKEDVPKCKKRFFSDGETRRSTHLPDARREYIKTKDTFACRFYDRLSNTSPCESGPGDGLLYMQCFDGDGINTLAGRKYVIRGDASPAILFKGTLDDNGTLRHEQVSNGDYVLTVQGCSEDSPMAVLEMSETIPQIRMLENGRLGVRAITPQSEPISNATVQVVGVGQRLTDDDGLAYFGTVPDGNFTFHVAKDGFQPVDIVTQKAKSVRAGPGGESAGAGGSGAAAGDAVVVNKRVDATAKLVPNKTPVVPKVIKIEARQVGTSSLNGKQKLPVIQGGASLPSSTSNSSDLNANPPGIVVRGSHPVLLKATTDPPGQLVTWLVTPNQSAGPAPPINPAQTVGDLEAQVETSATGSFSVQATAGSSSVIWNLVLVGVDVDQNSNIVIQNSGLQDFNQSISGPDGKKGSGLLPGDSFDPTTLTAVASGKFEFGKHAWSSEVHVTLKGGGASGTLGCDQVEVQILQNLVADNTAGEYTTKIAFTDIGTPARLLDAPAGSAPGYDGPAVASGLNRATGQILVQSPFVFTDGMFQLAKNDPTDRILRIGDSPSTGYNNHIETEKLSRIRGTVEFRTAVASFSKQSPNCIVVHGDAVWRVDYTGDVSISSGTGEWSKDTAQVIRVQKWQPIVSSSGVQGTDAGNALMEVFPPLASEITSNPKKVIPKP